MIINSNNITSVYSHLDNVKERIVLVTLWHLDGTTSEVRLTYPNFCRNGDDTSRAGQYLEEWVRDMTRYYLNVTAYQVHFGAVYQDGTERISSMGHFKKEVPIDKIFISKKCNQGKWVTPAAAEKMQAKKRAKHMEKKMREGRHPLSGAHIRAKASNQIYFN